MAPIRLPRSQGVGVLEAIGISATEERFYLALLKDQGAPIGEICRSVGISAQRGAAIAAALESKGLVSRLSAREHRVAAAPPDTALEPLLLHSHEMLERAGKSIAELANLYHSNREPRDTHELVQVVLGTDAVRKRFEQLQHGARDEVLLFVRPPQMLTGANQTELRLLRQGVRYRTLYDRASLRTPGAMNEILLYQSEGEQSRTVEGLPMKLAVADRSLALIPLSTSDSSMDPGAVVLHSSALLEGLVALFESLWRDAVPMDRGSDDPGHKPHRPPLAEQDSRILGLLLAGQTDEAVARQLGLSLRTVQRRVQRLMASARVTTRLQLGWYAHRQGWL